MSLSWRDRLDVFVSDVDVQITRTLRGRKAPPPQHAVVAYVREDEHAPVSTQAVVDALQQALTRLPRRDPTRWRGLAANARVVLSQKWAPATLIAHAATLDGSAEREAAVRHSLRSVYGDEAALYRIVIDQEHAATALAAGMDGVLLDRLAAVLRGAGIRVAAVEPLVSVAVRHALPLLAAQGAWLAVIERGAVVLARHDGHAWRSLRARRARGVVVEELARWLDQARALDGIEGDDHLVIVRAESALPSLGRRAGWSVTDIALDSIAPVVRRRNGAAA